MVTEELADGQESAAQQQARMSASSATRELDELMASLSDFKVQSNVSIVGGGGEKDGEVDGFWSGNVMSEFLSN